MKILLLLLLALHSQATYSQHTKNFIDQPYIEVQGMAEVELTPDIIYLSIAIDEKDHKDRDALQAKENDLIAILEKHGLDAEQSLLINDLSSQFHQFLFRGTRIVQSRRYQLKIDSIPVMGPLITDLEKQSISNIHISKSDHSQLEKAKLDVKIEALRNAKAKAGAMAEAIGQAVGKALYIMDQPETIPTFSGGRLDEIVVTGYGGSKRQAVDTPNLNVRPIRLQALVTVRYALD